MSGHKITDHPSLWTILGALRCVLCPPRARLTHGVDIMSLSLTLRERFLGKGYTVAENGCWMPIVGFNSTREAAKKARNEK